TGATAAVLVSLAALAVLVTVVAASNRTIRRQNVEIVRQYGELERSNRDLALARAEAEAERDQAREVTEFLVSSFRRPDPEQDGAKVTVAEVLGRAVKELEGRKIAPATQVTILEAVGTTYHGLGLVAESVDAWERTLATRRRVLSDGHPDILES